MQPEDIENRISCKNIEIDSESFYLTILLELDKLMEDVIGSEESKGFIGMVADRVGGIFYDKYKSALDDETMTPDAIAHVLVDLKRRIGGQFTISDISTDAIVLQNSRCPFGSNVVGKKALCSMTANVFGKITSNETGYAAIELDKTIANGDGYCRVIVHMTPIDTNKELMYEYFSV